MPGLPVQAMLTSDRARHADALLVQVLSALQLARDAGPEWPKAWHHWALFNVAVMDHYARRGEAARAQQHVAPAVQGFFRR